MNLYQDIFQYVLLQKNPSDMCPFIFKPPHEIIERESRRIIEEIKLILEDTHTDGPEAFEKIEAIVCLFEKVGSNRGNRHNFG